MDFYELSYQGRVRRLRGMAIKALESYPFGVARLRVLTIETNGIFRVDTQAGDTYMLRITDPKNSHEADEVHSEIAWLDALSRDTDLVVPVPIPSSAGLLVVPVQVEGVPEERLCTLFSWIPGRDLAEQVTPATMAALGAATARLHIHGRSFIPPAGFKIRTMNSVFPYADPSFQNIEPVVLFEDRFNTIITREMSTSFRRAADLVQQELDRLYGSGERPIVLHNDLHQWNVRVYRGKLALLDFEDLMWGYPIQDLGTTWMYFFECENAPALLDAYQEGYTRFQPWPEQRPGQLEVLIAARIFNLLNYILSSPVPEDQEIAPEWVERSFQRLQRLIPEAQRTSTRIRVSSSMKDGFHD